MIDEKTVLSVAQEPHAWTAFITGDMDSMRLHAVLDLLEQHAKGNDVLTARLAHVLMLLKRPRDAAYRLMSCTHRMCRAQRLLALVQLGKLENNPRLFVDVAAHTPHFGSAINPLELEAQMRLDYALCAAHVELGSEHATRHADRAVHVGLLIGCGFMAAAVASVTSAREAETNPREHANRLALLAVDTHRDGNLPLAEDLARTARKVLLRSNAYAEIPALAALVQHIVPDAEAWSLGARAVMDPTLPPPPLDPADPLLLLAHAFHHGAASAVHTSRLDKHGSLQHAVATLNLPPWPNGEKAGTAEAAYRCLRVLAHMQAQQPREAVVALRELVRSGIHLENPAAAVYVGGTALALVGAGAAYLDEYTPMQAYLDANNALARMPRDLALTVAGRLATVAPNAALVLAGAGNAVSALLDVASGVALLTEANGLMIGGRRVRGSPKDASGLREFAEDRLPTAPDRVVLHRYQRALAGVSVRGVAFEWRVARIEDQLARHLPARLTPQPSR